MHGSWTWKTRILIGFSFVLGVLVSCTTPPANPVPPAAQSSPPAAVPQAAAQAGAQSAASAADVDAAAKAREAEVASAREARAKAEKQARLQAATDARAKAEADAKAKAEADAKAKAAAEAQANAAFVCENDNSVVRSRVYALLHGYGDRRPEAFDYQKGLLTADTKTKGILDFDYDPNALLADISKDFLTRLSTLLAQYQPDELVIIGQSAGGVVAAYSVHSITFQGRIELQTLASPLRGYNVPAFFLDQYKGFGREMGVGLGPFTKPRSNVKVYHHKTVEDQTLRSFCGALASFCDPKAIQDNNLEGSKQFLYPQYDHATIMPAVGKLVIDCHR